jgi:hypothetical protein
MPNCLTMHKRSCSYVLCHWRMPCMFARRLYLITCLMISCSITFGFCILHVFMSFSKHAFEVSLMNYNVWHRSYIKSRYGLYNVKGENNVVILYFKYSLKDIITSWAPCLCIGIKKEIMSFQVKGLVFKYLMWFLLQILFHIVVLPYLFHVILHVQLCNNLSF